MRHGSCVDNSRMSEVDTDSAMQLAARDAPEAIDKTDAVELSMVAESDAYDGPSGRAALSFTLVRRRRLDTLKRLQSRSLPSSSVCTAYPQIHP